MAFEMSHRISYRVRLHSAHIDNQCLTVDDEAGSDNKRAQPVRPLRGSGQSSERVPMVVGWDLRAFFAMRPVVMARRAWRLRARCRCTAGH